MMKIVIIVKILRSFKSVLPDFKDLNISLLFFSIIYGKDTSGSIQYRKFPVN